MELFLGLVAGTGALLLAKRSRKAVRSAIGWTARKSGWVTSRVRSSLHETATVARTQYELGRAEAVAGAAAANDFPSIERASSTTVNGHATTMDHSLPES